MEEDMIFEGQTEQESTTDEVLTNEEQTEQDSSSSLDDILAGVNELLEQSASYNAYLEESEPESQSEIIAYDNGNAVEVSDLDAIAVQAANSSVYPGTWSGSIWTIFPPLCGRIPASITLHSEIVSIVIFLYYGDDLTFADGVVSRLR